MNDKTYKVKKTALKVTGFMTSALAGTVTAFAVGFGEAAVENVVRNTLKCGDLPKIGEAIISYGEGVIAVDAGIKVFNAVHKKFEAAEQKLVNKHVDEMMANR